ncbi:MAG: DUF4363 family protein [Peptococcaceae bacterium]|nr:DUF4363 family protein [Peptococcaceae bacterium]
MRTITYVGIGFILLVALSIYSYMALSTSARNLGGSLNSIEASIAQDNWRQASQSLRVTQTVWARDKSWWSLLVDHREIDTIDITLQRLEKYVAGKGRILAMGELSTLEGLMDHMSDKEALNLKNIL